MNNKIPLWFWIIFRNWGWETKYYISKNVLIVLSAHEFPRVLGAVSQKLWMKTKCFWEIYFSYHNMFLINHNITGCFQFVAIKSQRTALNAMEIQRFSAELIKEVTFQWTHSNECSPFGQLILDYEAWKILKSMLVSMDSIYQILVVYQSLW